MAAILHGGSFDPRNISLALFTVFIFIVKAIVLDCVFVRTGYSK